MAVALFALWSLQSTFTPSPAKSSQPAPSLIVEGISAQSTQVGPSLVVAGSPAPSAQPAPSPVEGSDLDGALIRNSGSTNTLPYTISVKTDGSVVVTVGSGTPEDRHLPLDQTAALFAKLRAAMPLDALARGRCMRSASFGTTTTVTFGGAVTPDLGCAPDPAARDLAGTVAEILHELRLSVMRIHAPPAPP